MNIVEVSRLIIRLLRVLVDEDEKETCDFKYYFNSEQGEGLSPFEIISNDLQIGVKSRIKKANVALIILECIVSENYWVFDIIELESIIGKIDNYSLEKLKTYNTSTWLRCLSKIPKEYLIFDAVPDANISSTFPFEQSILQISDINFDLRLTRSGITKILL